MTWFTQVLAPKLRAFPGDNGAQHWLAKRVQEVHALPLVVDVGASYAIRASGDLVQFDWDGAREATTLTLYPLDCPWCGRRVDIRCDGGLFRRGQLVGGKIERGPTRVRRRSG